MTMKDIKGIIAKNLIELRKANGLTQAQLAEKINYSDKAVSKWERGESSIDIETLFQLSELFHVEIDYFFQENAGENIEHYSTNRLFIMRKVGILILALMAILLIAVAVYVTSWVYEKSFANDAWVVFVYAACVGCLVSWIYCKLNKFKIAALVLISCTVWTLLASIYLTALINNFNFWMIFLVGVPIQAAFLVYKLLKVRKN